MITQLRNSNNLIDEGEVRKAYGILFKQGQVVEVRALEAAFEANSRFTQTLGGFFDNVEDLLKEIRLIKSAMGIYVTLQECNPDLLHRSYNQLKKLTSNSSTSDQHITRYRWMLVDCDPERTAGISSTDEEHQQAYEVCQDLRNDLIAMGWATLIEANSGNGYHLLVPIDLPNNAETIDLIKRVLAGLAQKYNTNSVKIDQTVYNPARICKLYGTKACKGSNTPLRPHRMARIESVPDTSEIVTAEQLEAMATPIQAHTAPQPILHQRNEIKESFTAEMFLYKHNISIKRQSEYMGGTKYLLERCAWDADHTDNAACVYQFADGRLGASCSHNSCNGKGWREFRLAFEPDAYTQKAPRHSQQTSVSLVDPSQLLVQAEKQTAEIDTQFVLDCLDQAEWGDSLLFAQLFRGKALYDHSSNEWYLWQNHYWELDESNRIKHYVSGHLASVYIRAGAALNLQVRGEENAEEDDTKARVNKLKGQIKALTERAFQLRQVSRNKNVLSFASSQTGMSITAKQWDRDPWLLAVPNGVLDLQLGQLRDGKPEDYIRTVCPTEWKGLHAQAPRWERFLQEIFEDREPKQRKELIAFLQRMFGYGITGDVSEHMFAVLYGEKGRNGKDTIQRALSHTLGNVSGAIEKDVLLDTGRQKVAGSASPHLMDLQGKRLAWANEPEKGARFNVGQVKDLSGGGDIPARGLFERKITKIRPSHLLILLTNHKPHADTHDTAFWTRLRFIAFNMHFVSNPQEENERSIDTNLWRTLEQETSGILAWLVRGCLSWQEEGLNTPQSVLDDGKEYREEEDVIKNFLDDCCIIKPDINIKASRLYEAYDKWCKDTNMHPLNAMNFGLMLKKRKLNKLQGRKGVFYQGIGLLDTDDVNTLDKVLTPYKPASEEGLSTLQVVTREHCEPFKQKVSKIGLHEGQNSELSVNSIHSVNTLGIESGLNEPVEPCEHYVNTLDEVFTLPMSTHQTEILAKTELATKKDEAKRLAAMLRYPRHHYQYGQFLENESSYLTAINHAPNLASIEKILAMLKRDEKIH